MSRKGRVARTTKESDVLVEINLDGTGEVTVDTGVPFYDHMLSQLGKHGAFDLNVKLKVIFQLMNTTPLKTQH